MGMIFIPKYLAFYGQGLPADSTSVSLGGSVYFNTSVKRVEIFIEPNPAAVDGAIIARYFLAPLGGGSPVNGVPVRAFDRIEVTESTCIKDFHINSADGLEHNIWVIFYNF